MKQYFIQLFIKRSTQIETTAEDSLELPQDYPLDEASALRVSRGRVAVSECWVEGVVLIRLHLQPAESAWIHQVLSGRVEVPLLLSIVSELTGGGQLCEITHRINQHVSD